MCRQLGDHLQTESSKGYVSLHSRESGNVGAIHYSLTDVSDGNGGTIASLVATGGVVMTGSRIPVNIAIIAESTGNTSYNFIAQTHRK